MACRRAPGRVTGFLTRRPSQASLQEDVEETEQRERPFWTMLFSVLKVMHKRLFPRFPWEMDRVQGRVSRSGSEKKNTGVPFSFLKRKEKKNSKSPWLQGNSYFREENQAAQEQTQARVFLIIHSSLLHLEWHYKSMLRSESEAHLFIIYNTCTSTHRQHRLVPLTKIKHQEKSKSHSRPAWKHSNLLAQYTMNKASYVGEGPCQQV